MDYANWTLVLNALLRIDTVLFWALAAKKPGLANDAFNLFRVRSSSVMLLLTRDILPGLNTPWDKHRNPKVDCPNATGSGCINQESEIRNQELYHF